jgi:hypothetical protein
VSLLMKPERGSDKGVCTNQGQPSGVCTSHRPSAGPPGEVLPLWPGWKWLQGLPEFPGACEGKKSGGILHSGQLGTQR